MERSRILVIEDNPDTRRFLEVMLGKEYEVSSAENGIIGIELARKHRPDLILLDVMLPILSGYDTCSILKKDEKTRHIPIIFLSAKNTVNDVTQGLNVGAEDYISKPFDLKELRARVQTRLKAAEQVVPQTLVLGDLKIEPSTRDVTFKNKTVHLTLTEFDLLRFLALNSGTIVSRDAIMSEIWKDQKTNTTDRTIDVHVRALRKKIPELSRHIVSVYGVGYKYEP